ncbi:MAG: type II secretion system protein [Candidatus Omnitrophota bacterium]
MDKRGFTLIELTLVIVIMGLVCAGLAALIYQTLQGTHKPEVITIATALAKKEAERVIRFDFANLVDENRDSPLAYSGDLSQYSREVRVDSIDTVQPDLGSDPTMETYKVVEVRVHHASIGYLSIIFLKVVYE